MLPNRFPDAGEAPEYNTVDATLWYFEAIRQYVASTRDQALLRELFPVLADIVAWHTRGTRYNIHVDPADGLLYAGEPGGKNRPIAHFDCPGPAALGMLTDRDS